VSPQQMKEFVNNNLNSTQHSFADAALKTQSLLLQSQVLPSKLTIEPERASISPRKSIIGEFTKEGGFAALRGSTKSISKATQNLSGQLETKDKLVIDKRTYQDLISYICKADSKRQDPDKNAQIINIYSDA
jgi:hypothetical protein